MSDILCWIGFPLGLHLVICSTRQDARNAVLNMCAVFQEDILVSSVYPVNGDWQHFISEIRVSVSR